MSATTTILDFINRSNFSSYLISELTALLSTYTETGRSFAGGAGASNDVPFAVSMSGPNGAIITYTIDYRQWQPTGQIPGAGTLGPISSFSSRTPEASGGLLPVLTGCIGRGDSSSLTQSLIRLLNRGWFPDGPAAHPGAYPTEEQLLRAFAPQLIPQALL
jgi:hypothetical protein